jgi:hypothetical protein
MCADSVCFKNDFLTAFFRCGKTFPVARGGGVDQPVMEVVAETVRAPIQHRSLGVDTRGRVELRCSSWWRPKGRASGTPSRACQHCALATSALWPSQLSRGLSTQVRQGAWLQIFPEGKVNTVDPKGFLPFKWGVGRIVCDAATGPVPPLVVPWYHRYARSAPPAAAPTASSPGVSCVAVVCTPQRLGPSMVASSSSAPPLGCVVLLQQGSPRSHCACVAAAAWSGSRR